MAGWAEQHPALKMRLVRVGQTALSCGNQEETSSLAGGKQLLKCLIAIE